MAVFPILPNDEFQAIGNVFVMNLNCQLTATIKTSRCEINRSNNCSQIVGKQQFGVQFKYLELVYFYANVLHDAHAANGLYKFGFF